MLIHTDTQLQEFACRAARSDVLAVDTEFIRERTYSPDLCLIQLGTDTEQVAIDPFTVKDTQPVRQLFLDPRITKVFHACSQDLEVLYAWCGVLPQPLFDTQIAYSFVSEHNQIGYGPLVREFCRVDLPKTETCTDWSQRPLEPSQLEYALDDVRYLPAIWRRLVTKLNMLGRMAWMDSEADRLVDPRHFEHSVDDAWVHLRRVSTLSPQQAAVAREVAAWREERAIKYNRPRRWILSDEIVIEIARRAPRNTVLLEQIRGTRDLYPEDKTEIVQACLRGLSCPPEAYPEVHHRIKLSLEAECVCDLMYALTRIIAEREGVAPGVLASRDDLIEFMLHPQTSSIATTWRSSVLGEPLACLLDGQMGLTIKDGHVELF